ncbi:PstS family phosphate ABC transporter substrate-binding protein [Gloeocapsopsis dulcis]|uniref:Phosphate ABC transporter substrate-binding protein n=1 Tax=Gloeocapsopsis dulcis AAB1 = 1H9 TaxID=1433147 RepID=A0A6N8FV66_9CHRO|nr:PstS family phosphate ABC transporter substrate-binding protein [Gloeocapsopsis dulcis]MUL36482.1 phosphate ABC transporter substrate-binding protein [Gloeocapsopsis dulcis AAB1 = 1H9]WNN87768.1 PstS family phosphate ABC transporter substrate-binding protein [Gloeocapsopsis dulcis]
MSQKNETAVLVSALFITLAVIGGGLWWFANRSGIDIDFGRLTAPSEDDNSSPIAAGSTNFASVQNVPSGLFNYGGSTTWAPIRLAVDSAIQAARPEFRLRYVNPTSDTPGSASGIRMLVDGTITFAQSSRPVLDQEIARAQQRGFGLKQTPVAIDGLAIAVNPNLDIPGLTIEQIRAIYTGKIANWNQVGGPNLPILPFSRRSSDGGTVEFFIQDILANQSFGSNVEFVPDTTQALRRLAVTPGGIYYASAPEVVPQCTIKSLPVGRGSGEFVPPYQEPFVPLSQCPSLRNSLNLEAFQTGQYPITRNLFVVIKQNSQTDEQAGDAYANFLLTTQGQELIEQTGFVRIR